MWPLPSPYVLLILPDIINLKILRNKNSSSNNFILPIQCFNYYELIAKTVISKWFFNIFTTKLRQTQFPDSYMEIKPWKYLHKKWHLRSSFVLYHHTMIIFFFIDIEIKWQSFVFVLSYYEERSLDKRSVTAQSYNSL